MGIQHKVHIGAILFYELLRYIVFLIFKYFLL